MPMTPASHRDQLVAMLSEAAEIEHCLMCSYLYAAFSLKVDEDEGLAPDELAAVRGWKREVHAIAREEMLHLALVNNLLIAIGARPHYRRFNFPVGSGIFPADVVVSLAPFDRATLDHFIYLERPRTADAADAADLRKASYRRYIPGERLMPFAEDYRTVGELYEGVAESFRLLCTRHGEPSVFVGAPALQLDGGLFRLPGLRPVRTREDALAAIDVIVRQGEGSERGAENSHYARYCAIRAEWERLRAARADFVPYRPVARDPVMRQPVVDAPRVHVGAEPAALLLDAGNAAYGHMLRLMAMLSEGGFGTALDRAAVADQTVFLMRTVDTIATGLTRLPANPDLPGVTAGLTFTVSRSLLSFQALDSAEAIVGESMQLLGDRLETLAEHLPALREASARSRSLARTWRAGGFRVRDAAAGVAVRPAGPVSAASAAASNRPTPSPEPGAASAPPASAPAGTTVDEARGRAVVVRFDHARCIHARHCVLGEPAVFVANQPGEWIHPDAVDVDRVVRVAYNCPSGAITYDRVDGGANEQPPPVNVARVRENGPLAFHAELELAGQPIGYRATLCRCGRSANKPYCDGSHVAAEFVASGEPPTRPSEPLPVRGGVLRIEPQRNGPLRVRGSLELCAGTGRTVERTTSAWLCRCGQSRNKPYCDESHRAAGFVADGD